MNNIKSFINTPNILISLIVIVALFAQTLPLVQVLNFEFSFLFSIISFLASGILTIYYLRKFKTFGMLLAIIRMKYRYYLLLLFAPLLISLVSNLLFQICPIWDGILYFMVIVIPAFYFGLVLGAFSFWSNKKFSYVILGGIFLLIAFSPIIEFYIYPQVYFFNVIVGIIPGTIYDEEILISSKLIIFRILQLVLFTSLIYSIIKAGNINRRNKNLYILITLSGTILFFLLKPFLGFETTKYDLYKNLNVGILSLAYEMRISDNLTSNSQRLLTLEHFYYMDEIEQKTKLERPKNLVTYVFKDKDQKGELFGSKAANIAKPWMNEIYLDYNSARNTLEHELTHLYAAQIGSTPFKIADGYNIAMLEGYAMAIEGNYSGYDIHYMALLAKESGYNFNIPELFSRFNFFGQVSSLSYITAGSFVKYLIEIYGIEKVNLIYQDLDFEKYLEKNLGELSTDFVQYLEDLNYPINEHRANLFFGRNPITKKVCPRTVAKEMNAAWKLYREKSYALSRRSFYNIFNYSESYSALIGILYSNNKLGYYPKSLALLDSKMSQFHGTSSYYSALLNLGDQLSLNNNFERAISVYQSLSEFNPTARYKNLADIRMRLIDENVISKYLIGSDFDKYGILKLLDHEKLFDASIPIMIELSESLGEDFSTFDSFLERRNIKNLSSNSAYEISKYFLRNLEFVKSLEYAEMSIQECNENFRFPILKSHRKKIEWLNKL